MAVTLPSAWGTQAPGSGAWKRFGGGAGGGLGKGGGGGEMEGGGDAGAELLDELFMQMSSWWAALSL